MSFPPGTEMFQFPGFASPTYGFSGRYPLARVGCPIRRSSDQSLLAAPRGFSQRATSFIASWRQGIHQMPLLSSAPTSDNHTITPPGLRPGGDPAVSPQGSRRSKRMRRPPPGTIPASTANYKCWPIAGRSQQAASIPMPNAQPCRRRKQKAGPRDLPAPAVPRRMQESLLACPHDGHLVTTSRCPRNMRRYPGPKGRRRADGLPLRAAGPGPGHDGRTSPIGEARPGGPGPT